MAPTFGNGKICYIEIPATDTKQSSEFYRSAFGWDVRRQGDGSLGFDDAVGEVSGTWVLDRPPSSTPGLVIYIMVDDANAASEAIVNAGGEIVLPANPNADIVFAHFRDPAGNVLGIYQHKG
ncbi:MAG: hypothetical protein NVSMB31_13210 [Vulcanimicrobiaceae bacterium]